MSQKPKKATTLSTVFSALKGVADKPFDGNMSDEIKKPEHKKKSQQQSEVDDWMKQSYNFNENKAKKQQELETKQSTEAEAVRRKTELAIQEAALECFLKNNIGEKTEKYLQEIAQAAAKSKITSESTLMLGKNLAHAKELTQRLTSQILDDSITKLTELLKK